MTDTTSHKAYMYLVKLLSARDYSEHKLREKLREKKYPSNEIENAINEIKAKGYLREDAYTEARVKAFMHKGYSPNYIRQKLAQEHLTITVEEIGDIFAENRETPEDQIERLARKKFHKKDDIDFKEKFKEESKVLRYLLSKGHDFASAKRIIKSITNEAT